MPRLRPSLTKVAVFVCLGGFFMAPASAQNREADHGPRRADAGRDAPAPARPNYRDRFQDRSQRYRERYPRVYDLRPQFDQDRYGHRFGVPAFDELREERRDNAYHEGYGAGRDAERYEIQAERGFAAYQEAMAGGHEAFVQGDYGLAARQFLLAAALNQGDPASRVCAANAQVALGEYESAGRLIERAFELQPKLVYLPMDIRAAYGQVDDFDRHLAALRQAAEGASDDADLWFLLGYDYFYSKAMARAADALKRAADLRPESRLFAQLAELARPRGDAGGRRSRGTSSDPGRTP